MSYQGKVSDNLDEVEVDSMYSFFAICNALWTKNLKVYKVSLMDCVQFLSVKT